MPYAPQTWQDLNPAYPVSAARMTVIESGIQTAQAGVDDAAVDLQGVSVKAAAFAAKGDGVTDDYAAITAAIASLPVDGGFVFFPAGTYMLSKPLLVPTKVVLLGLGWDLCRLTNLSSFPHGQLNGAVNLASLGGGVPLKNVVGVFPASGGVVQAGGHTLVYTSTSGSGASITLNGVSSYIAVGTIADSTDCAHYTVTLGDTLLGTGGAFGCRLERIGVYCASVAGSAGVFSNRIQEGGGLHRVLIRDFVGTGLRISQTGGSGTKAANWAMQGLFLIAASGGATVYGAWIEQNANPFHSIDDVTFDVAGGGSVTGSALRLDGARGNVTGIHGEDYTTVVDIGPQTQCIALHMAGIDGGVNVTDVVKIANNDNHVALFAINRRTATNVLNDLQTGVGASTASDVSYHIIGGGGNNPRQLTSDLTRGDVRRRVASPAASDFAVAVAGVWEFDTSARVWVYDGAAMTRAAYDEWFENRRSSDVAANHRKGLSVLSGLLNGQLYATYAVARNGGTYTKIRVCVAGSAGSGITDVRGGVWDVGNNTLLGETANFQASVVINTVLEIAFNANVTLSANQAVWVGWGQWGTGSPTTGTLVGESLQVAGIANVSGGVVLGKSVAWTGGALPSFAGATARASLPYAELI